MTHFKTQGSVLKRVRSPSKVVANAANRRGRPSYTSLAAVCLAVLFAAGANSAQAWQVPEILPAESPLPAAESPDLEPSPVMDQPSSLDVDPSYNSAWSGFGQGGDLLTDTSLIAWWNRAFVEEGAAGVPPDRAWWRPSAISGQLVWLNRNVADPSVLLTGGVLNPITLATDHSTAVSMSDLVMPVEAGFRGSVMFGRAGSWQPELAYLGIFDQNASARYAPQASALVTETGAPFFDLTLTNPVTDITVSYESDLNSVECNFWFDDGWRFQPLVGARWIQQSEEFEQFETQDWGNRNLASFTNDLIGGQLGFRTFLLERGKLSMFAIAKGGMYYNQVRLFADVQSGGAVLNSMEQTGNATSCVGEVNLTAVWQFTPYFNFHFGYTGLWLSQVGLVGDQFNNFSFATGSGTFDYDSISYQGGHLGVTLAW